MQKTSAFGIRDRQLLTNEGWSIINEKPIVLREKLGGTATGIAALIVLCDIARRNSASNSEAVKLAVNALISLRDGKNNRKLDRAVKTLENLIA